jgi:hypothetical protein
VRITNPLERADKLIAAEVEKKFFAEAVVHVTPLSMGKGPVLNQFGQVTEYRSMFFAYIGVRSKLTGLVYWAAIEFGCEVFSSDDSLIPSIVKGVDFAFNNTTQARAHQERQALSNGKVAPDVDLGRFGNVPLLGQENE